MATAQPRGFDPLEDQGGPASMGALAQIISQSGRNPDDEQLAFAAGLGGPNPNGTTAGALSNALRAKSDYRLERDKLMAQYVPLIQQSMQAQFTRNMVGDILNGTQVPGMPSGPGGQPAGDPTAAPTGMQPPTAGPAGAPGGAMPPATAAPAQSPASRLASMSIDQIAALKQLGFDYSDAWKVAKEGFELQPNTFRDIPGVGRQYVPDIKTGVTIGPDGSVVPIAGAAQALAGVAGATTDAQKAAENRNTLLPPTFVSAGNGHPIGGTVAQQIDRQTASPVAASSPPATGAAPAPSGKLTIPGDNDMPKILSDEFDKALQRVHDTNGDPAQLQRANDDLKAITDEMKKTGVSYVPAPLRNQYPTASGPLSPPGGGPATVASLNGPQGLQSAAEAEGAKTTATKAAEAGQAYQSSLHDKVEEEFQLVNRNKNIMPLLDQFNTGGLAPEMMLKLGNTVATSGLLPPDMAKSLGARIAGGDTTAGKVLENQLASAGILTMLQTLDKEGKPNRAIFQAVQQAQEGLKSGNTTLKDVFELQKRLYDVHYNEQQAMTQAIKNGSYDPRTWAGDYSKVRNDQLQQAPAPLPSAPKFSGFSAVLKN